MELVASDAGGHARAQTTLEPMEMTAMTSKEEGPPEIIPRMRMEVMKRTMLTTMVEGVKMRSRKT
jgi:hypothetical protein